MVEHVSAIAILILLECVLSADNALVLAVLVKHLPRSQQPKALMYGLAGAFLFRGVAILMAQKILEIWWLQGLGAVYLAYLSIDHFAGKGTSPSPGKVKQSRGSFWRTVAAVELTDIAFAMDSILVAVALTNKLWVIYTGAAIGIVAMRILAAAIVRLLYRYPQIESVAYLLVGWISVKLFFSTWELFSGVVLGTPHKDHLLRPWIFWSVLILIVLLGGWHSFRHPETSSAAAEDRPSPEEVATPIKSSRKNKPAV